MLYKDKNQKERHEWQRKLMYGEITAEEYYKVDPRIRMGGDNGLDDPKDIIP